MLHMDMSSDSSLCRNTKFGRRVSL